MRRSLPALALLPALSVSTPAVAILPAPVRAMIESAFMTGDQSSVNAVVRAAKATNPNDASEIDQLVQARQLVLDKNNVVREADSTFLQKLDGEIELGASRSTGNANTVGAYGAFRVVKAGRKWDHKLTGRLEYLRTEGETTTERAIAAYEPKYKLSDRLFVAGLAQYDRDPILGYSSRYTGGAGIGYAVVASPSARVEVTGGPAVRRTNFTDEPSKTTLAGRGSIDARWQITPTLGFTHNSSAFFEDGGISALATTAFDTRLIGAVKARLSYDVKYEKDPPEGTDPLDTTSRVTFIYSF
ncbi:DUF481 domain-containing protein [Sphingomonas sp. ID0503]|uniref:DUF481 domain-containing protein n=1 Tax=Sphingomonas sp. ID0503 TaxID=3399691 RepID=UPI003AFB7583